MRVRMKMVDVTMSRRSANVALEEFRGSVTPIAALNGDMIVMRCGSHFDTDEELVSYLRSSLKEDNINLVIEVEEVR